ncbi:MAG: tRNA guanosine(34) transglycosylase Tgt [Desulfosudaceae bacterium]
MFAFKKTTDCPRTRARAGVISTVRGEARTPVFMPVGTLATVKSLAPEDLLACGAEIILGNTYHLYLRPGCEVIDLFAGVHSFMDWDGPLLTDSGGFQVFSLAGLSKVSEEGVTFQSHIDGSAHELSPEKAMDIQACLGSDIRMCLDQCIAYPADKGTAARASDLTTRWARRCLDRWRETGGDQNSGLFGIVQGGMYPDLRAQSAGELVALNFPGYAVGGLSVGEPVAVRLEVAEQTLELLPPDKPRYIMGVGTPAELVELVARGADMFDCVMPTRNARNGKLFTSSGSINIRNAAWRLDTGPIDPECSCPVCRRFSRAYLRHLFMSRELLAYRLASLHNVYYFVNLVREAREAVVTGTFDRFRRDFYQGRETSALAFNEDGQ